MYGIVQSLYCTPEIKDYKLIIVQYNTHTHKIMPNPIRMATIKTNKQEIDKDKEVSVPVHC